MSQVFQQLGSRHTSPLRSLFKIQNRRSKSRLSFEAPQIKQLIFSLTQIGFFYQVNTKYEYLINKNLKLTNTTGTRIGFKIKSNNPQNYQVTPSQDKLEDGATCQIRIKLFLNKSLTNITKYNLDKFLIQWGPIQQITNIPKYNKQCQKILKVSISTDLNEAKSSEIKKNIQTSQQQIQKHSLLLQKYKNKIQKLNTELGQLENQPKPWIVSKGMGIILAIFSFALGYLIF